jgi:uncharacterized protein YceH (UPF0502 family)
MSESIKAEAAVEVKVEAARPWAVFGKPVAGVVIFQRNRLVNGVEDGWPEFCLGDTNGKPDESYIVLYSGLATGRAKTVGTARKADKAAAAAKKAAEKEVASAGPSEVEVLRAEVSALKAEVAALREQLAALLAK